MLLKTIAQFIKWKKIIANCFSYNEILLFKTNGVPRLLLVGVQI